MWKPDINFKCPSGQNTRRCAGTMAHRRRLPRGKVTCTILGVLGVGMLLAGSIFISNQTTLMRAEIAGLDSRRECLEAGSGTLMTQWNAATSAQVIVRRARAELGLIVPEEPGLVLVCQVGEPASSGSGLWKKFLSRFGGADAAQAAGDQMNLVVGSMVSLTPRSAQAATIIPGNGP
jgi:hypothetical protein